MRPSTAHPEALPGIAALRRLTQTMAMLDAILCPEWLYRYYSFNSHWSTGEQMASMRDGCGDDWFLLFDATGGAALKGYAHESMLAGNSEYAARIQTTVPTCFGRFLEEPAFSMDRATFCLWCQHADSTWHVVPAADGSEPPEDGSAELLRILDGEPSTYHAWAESYYERKVSLAGVRAIYDHQPLDTTLVISLNPEVAWQDAVSDAAEIGYALAAHR